MLSVYVVDKVMNYDIIWDDSINPGFFHLKDAKKEFSDMSGLVQHYKQTAVKLFFLYLFIYLLEQLQLAITIKLKLQLKKKNSLQSTHLCITTYTLHTSNLQYATYWYIKLLQYRYCVYILINIIILINIK